MTGKGPQLRNEVPVEPAEPVTPIFPDAPVTPAVPDPGRPVTRRCRPRCRNQTSRQSRSCPNRRSQIYLPRLLMPERSEHDPANDPPGAVSNQNGEEEPERPPRRRDPPRAAHRRQGAEEAQASRSQLRRRRRRLAVNGPPAERRITLGVSGLHRPGALTHLS